MSNTYKLTEKHQLTVQNLELINQINQKTGKELRVESDYCFFTSYGDDHKIIKFGHQEYEHLYESEFGADEMKVLEVAFNPENIQRLLCELDLGVNEEYVSESDGREQEGEYGEDCRDKTKYRKNGSLVFAPEIGTKIWTITPQFSFVVDESKYSPLDQPLIEQGLVFDNKEACQLWADKLKIAYALKQRIVEAESEQDGELGQCYVSINDIRKIWTLYSFAGFPKQLLVSTNAKDILMSDDVSVEEFKALIEVFSL
jgi:hypothetical protein